MDNINNYIETNKERFLNELSELLKIPSISADSKYESDVLNAASYVKESLDKAGCQITEIIETDGFPVVYGEITVNSKAPTVLVYGHYDVQPADPIELWSNPAFEPIIKKTSDHPEGAIYARGASDDKGQMFMHIKALEYLNRTNNLSCNVKFMIEGEEEIGSVNLYNFVEQHKEKLSNDIILISDTGMISNDLPSITTGLRGLSYVEVEVTGPNRDLHSGLYGGAVANPINILSKMISQLHDENNRITIPGFYDYVEIPTEDEREVMSNIPFDLKAYKTSIGINDTYGEEGFTTLERASVRPSLDVNGIWGGYIGEGAKTVIPSKAHAKISMRLVPNQDWKRITNIFKDYFENIAPKGVQVKVKPHHGGQGYVTPTNTIAYQAASKAYQNTFNKLPIPQRSGGSIPIVALFEEILESKSILMGFGLNSDAIHSPDEHFGVWNFCKGIETIVDFYNQYKILSNKN